MKRKEDLTTFLTKKGYTAIPMRQSALGLLLLDVKVNNVPASFILDTGAGSTVVDIAYADKLNLVLQKDNAEFTGAGAGGGGLEVVPAEGNKIEFGDHIIHDLTFSVMSLFEHVNETMLQLEVKEEFAGVIGVDILKPGKAIIDYSSMTFYLLAANGNQ